MQETPSILIVDDDRQIRTMLRRYLVEERFTVLEAADGAEMRQVLASQPVDIVLMDLTLPGEDGLSLARFIRQTSAVPIIMLTGKSDVIDRVAGLEAGADDYIAKPFHLREVLARIRTVMRRATPTPTPTPSAQSGAQSRVFYFGQWQLDLHRRCLLKNGNQTVPLTAGEFELLKIMVEHSNRVLSRDVLMDLTRGQEWSPFDRAIDTQIGRLRKKMESDTGNPELIKTVRGAGYVFSASVTAK